MNRKVERRQQKIMSKVMGAERERCEVGISRLEGRLDRAMYMESEDVEEVWGEFKKSEMDTVGEVCGMQHYRNAKRTRWLNEEVKQAVKKKKVAGLPEVVAAEGTRGKRKVPAG